MELIHYAASRKKITLGNTRWTLVEIKAPDFMSTFVLFIDIIMQEIVQQHFTCLEVVIVFILNFLFKNFGDISYNSDPYNNHKSIPACGISRFFSN